MVITILTLRSANVMALLKALACYLGECTKLNLGLKPIPYQVPP